MIPLHSVRARRVTFLPTASALFLLLCVSGCGGDHGVDSTPARVPTFRTLLERPGGNWVEDPIDMKTSPDGTLFVLCDRDYYAEYGSSVKPMRVFTATREFVREFPVDLDEYAVTSNRIFGIPESLPEVVIYDHQGQIVGHFDFEAPGTAELSSRFRIAGGPDNRVYVVDRLLRRVQRFSPEGVSQAVWGSRGTENDQLERPDLVTTDSEGSVYILDADLWRVQKFSPDGDLLTLWNLPLSVPIGVPFAGRLAVDHSGRPIVMDTSLSQARVLILPAAGGEPVSWTLPTDAQTVRYPAMAIVGDDELVILVYTVFPFARFSLAGEFLGSSGHWFGAQPGEVKDLANLVALADGTFLVFDGDTRRIDKYDAMGGHVGVLAIPEGTSGYSVLVAPTPHGDFWLADRSYRTRVRLMTAGGIIQDEWNWGKSNESLIDLESDRVGRAVLLIENYDNSGYDIEVHAPGGDLVAAYSLPYGSNSVADMAVDERSNAWLLEYGGGLRSMDLRTGQVDTYDALQSLGEPDSQYRDLVVGPDNLLYTVDQSHERGVVFDPRGGFHGFFGETELEELLLNEYRTPLAVSPQGVVWVASRSGRVAIFEP
jgi:hypothetical protein